MLHTSAERRKLRVLSGGGWGVRGVLNFCVRDDIHLCVKHHMQCNRKTQLYNRLSYLRDSAARTGRNSSRKISPLSQTSTNQVPELAVTRFSESRPNLSHKTTNHCRSTWLYSSTPVERPTPGQLRVCECECVCDMRPSAATRQSLPINGLSEPLVSCTTCVRVVPGS